MQGNWLRFSNVLKTLSFELLNEQTNCLNESTKPEPSLLKQNFNFTFITLGKYFTEHLKNLVHYTKKNC